MAGASFNPAPPPPSEAACSRCGASMPATAAFCPACGRSMKPLSSRDRIAAACSYCTFIPAAVLLFLPSFRRNGFVRFHAWQSLMVWGLFLLVSLVCLYLSNFTAALLLLLIGILAGLAMFFLWIVLTLKSWQGERLALPLFGTLAARLR